MIPRTLVCLSLVTIALAGCITDETPAPDLDADAAATMLPTGPITTIHEGSFDTGVATPAMSVNQGSAYQFPLDAHNNTTTGWVLEVEWTAVNAASERLDLWVREICDCAIDPTNPQAVADAPRPTVQATGPSVLRLAFEPSALDRSKEYEILVRAAQPVGAAGFTEAQAFTLHLTTFVEDAFDPEYSALS